MCTLTFVPSERGAIITTNRDENPSRNATELSPYKSRAGKEFLIAREPVHGGTNLVISKESRPEVRVLLNGAFHAHTFGKKYRLSRGLMVLDSLDYHRLDSFRAYDFNGIEPFTMVRISDEIEELRWDSNKLFYTKKEPNQNHIWSSAQLYTTQVRDKREKWFENFLVANKLNAETLADFHHNAGDGDLHNDLIMNRNDLVKTVSISQMAHTISGNTVRHWNLEMKNETQFNWPS